MLDEIKRIRNKKNLSLRELERISTISKTNINQIENSELIPGIDTVCKLSTAFDMEPIDLFSTLIEGENYCKLDKSEDLK